MRSTIYHGGGIGKAKFNTGGGGVSVDEKVKISVADTSTSYLNDKISVVSPIVKTIITPGANEKLELSLSSLPAAKTKYFLHYGTGAALGVETFIPSTTAGTMPGAVGIGHYIRANAVIKSMTMLIPKFISYDPTHYVRFQIKTLVADGSRVADITSASGINLLNYDFVFPNTSGSYRYYIGKRTTGYNLPVNQGEMVFMVICSMTVNTALGACIMLEVEEV